MFFDVAKRCCYTYFPLRQGNEYNLNTKKTHIARISINNCII